MRENNSFLTGTSFPFAFEDATSLCRVTVGAFEDSLEVL
jgi:hypothetical protein